MKAPQGGVAADVWRCRSPTSCSSATRSRPGFAKTAFGLRDWAPELCVGEFALPERDGQPRPAEADAPRRLRTAARARS